MLSLTYVIIHQEKSEFQLVHSCRLMIVDQNRGDEHQSLCMSASAGKQMRKLVTTEGTSRACLLGMHVGLTMYHIVDKTCM